MFSEAKVKEIYYMTDVFCKEFTLQQEKYMIEDKKTKHRNKSNRVSDAEIMVILILFNSGGFRCLLKTVDIRSPKTVISVHFSYSLPMAMQIY